MNAPAFTYRSSGFLASAFESARLWRDEGLEFRLSFNVSGASLANLELPDHLAQPLDGGLEQAAVHVVADRGDVARLGRP
mgnify:CR=1 FL=1